MPTFSPSLIRTIFKTAILGITPNSTHFLRHETYLAGVFASFWVSGTEALGPYAVGPVPGVLGEGGVALVAAGVVEDGQVHFLQDGATGSTCRMGGRCLAGSVRLYVSLGIFRFFKYISFFL